MWVQVLLAVPIFNVLLNANICDTVNVMPTNSAAINKKLKKIEKYLDSNKKPVKKIQEPRAYPKLEIGKLYKFAYATGRMDDSEEKLYLKDVTLERISLTALRESGDIYAASRVYDYEERYLEPVLGQTTCVLCDIIHEKKSYYSELNKENISTQSEVKSLIVMIDNQMYTVFEECFLPFVKVLENT
jgi:hypothetical protein